MRASRFLGVLVCLGLVATALFGWYGWLRFGPGPRIVVSRATTYITEPLAEDGMPDYLQYLRQQRPASVPAADNAAVAIWQAVGPSEIPLEFREEYFQQLGMDPLPEEGRYLVRLSDPQTMQKGLDWLSEVLESRGESLEELQAPEELDDGSLSPDELKAIEQLQVLGHLAPSKSRLEESYDRLVTLAFERPWSPNVLPPLDQWIRNNEHAFDLLTEAAQRPKYVEPLIATGEPPLLNTLQVTNNGVHALAHSLRLRVTWHLGAKNYEQAVADVKTMHRMARLMSEGHINLNDYLFALSIDRMACRAHIAVLASPGVPTEMLTAALKELSEMERWSKAAEAIDQGERLSMLDTTVDMYRTLDPDRSFGSFGRPLIGHLQSDQIDWNLILRDINRNCDVMVQALQTSDRKDREAIMMEIEERVSKKHNWLSTVHAALSRRARSQVLSNIVNMILLPPGGSLADMQDETNLEIDLATVAAALGVYHAHHGSFPEKLEELVPSELRSVPVEIYVDGPLRYERRGTGYLLYSVGRDGEDNGGSNLSRTVVNGEFADGTDDDHSYKIDDVIRTPLPPLTAVP